MYRVLTKTHTDCETNGQQTEPYGAGLLAERNSIQSGDGRIREIQCVNFSAQIREICAQWVKSQPHSVRLVEIETENDATATTRATPGRIIVVYSAGINAEENQLVQQCLSHPGAVGILWIIADYRELDHSWYANKTRFAEHMQAFATAEDFERNCDVFLNAMSAGIMGVSQSIYQQSVTKKTAQQKSVSESDLLSSREVEVLELASKGFKQREIAKILELSIHTISGYLKSIYAKLQVNTCNEAVYEARNFGYLRSR